MFRKKIFTKIIAFFLCFVIVFCDLYNPSEAQAYDGVRDDPSKCNIPDQADQIRESNPCYTVNFDTSKNYCEVGDLKFSAFVPVNRDLDWELFPLPGNPHCISFIALYTAILVSIHYAGRAACAATGLGSALLSGTAIPGLGPQTLVTSILLGNLCAAAVTQCALSSGTQVAACGSIAPCCASMAAYLAAISSAVAALAIIWGIAKEFFENSKICGAGWTAWQKEEEISETEENKRDPKWIRTKGPYRRYIENIFSPGLHKTLVELGGESSAKTNGQVPAEYSVDSGSAQRNNSLNITKDNNTRSIENIFYREYIFGGMEYEDNGSGACKNPWTEEERVKILGYSSDNQRYYYVGSGEKSAPNFACSRFLKKTKSDPTSNQGREAYDCCVNRSQSAMCIENKDKYIFCENASKCYLGVVNVEVYNAKKGGDYMCAKSFSLCPYNVPLAGGTENDIYDSDPEYADVKLNFCQHLNHCVRRPLLPSVKSSSLTGLYISSACYDMKGDSQNSYQYNSGLSIISTRNFTAPFIQCFTETMQNIFTNRAGRDICSDQSFDDMIGCGGDENIQYRAGDLLPDDQSFFIKIQNNYQMILKLALTFSIIMFGISILIAVPKQHLEKKVLMQYMIKMLLVVFFALGNGWHIGFANSVIGISTAMANITFFPNLFDGSKEKIDGCVFPRLNYETANSGTRDYDNRKYPPGKDYLRVWDTLDCKIVRALGYAGNISIPNIILMMIAGFFTGALGVIMFVASFIFGFILLSIALRAMHIFLISMSGVVILLFISPVTITMVMFERTKGIFTNWLKQLIGFSLQPMILFVYISIFLTVFDIILVGSAKYNSQIVEISGTSSYYNGATKIDEQKFYDDYGFIQQKNIDCSGDAADNSIYCIYYAPKFGTLSGFNAIGFGIPILKNLNQQKIETIAKAALLMFIFLNFMDQMTTFSSKLVGGAIIASNWSIKPSDLVRNFNWAMRGIQKRGTRGLLKAGRYTSSKISDLLSADGDNKNSKNAKRDAINAKKDSDSPDSSNGNSAGNNNLSRTENNSDGAGNNSLSRKENNSDGAGNNSLSRKEDNSDGAGNNNLSRTENNSDGAGNNSLSRTENNSDGAGNNSLSRTEDSSKNSSDGAGNNNFSTKENPGDQPSSGGSSQDLKGKLSGGGVDSGSQLGTSSESKRENGQDKSDKGSKEKSGDSDKKEGGQENSSGLAKSDLPQTNNNNSISDAGDRTGKDGDPNKSAAGSDLAKENKNDPTTGGNDSSKGAKDGSLEEDGSAKTNLDDQQKPASVDKDNPILPKSEKDSDIKLPEKNDAPSGDKGNDKDKESEDNKGQNLQEDDLQDDNVEQQNERDNEGGENEQGYESSEDYDADDEDINSKAEANLLGDDKNRGQNRIISRSKTPPRRSRSNSPSLSKGANKKPAKDGSLPPPSNSQDFSKGIMPESSGIDSLLKNEGLLNEVSKGALSGPTNKGILSGSLDSKSSDELPWLGLLGKNLGAIIEPTLKSINNATDYMFGIKGDDRTSGATQPEKTKSRNTLPYSAGSAINALPNDSQVGQSKAGGLTSKVLDQSNTSEKKTNIDSKPKNNMLPFEIAGSGGKAQGGSESPLDLTSVILTQKTDETKSTSGIYSSDLAKQSMISSSNKLFKPITESKPSQISPPLLSPSNIELGLADLLNFGQQKPDFVNQNAPAKKTGESSMVDQQQNSRIISEPVQSLVGQQSRRQGVVSGLSPQDIKIDFAQNKFSNLSNGVSAFRPSGNSAFKVVSGSAQSGSSSQNQTSADLVKESIARVRFQQSNSVFGGQVEQPQITSPASSSAKPNTNLQTPINNALEKYISDPLSKAIDPFVSAISRGTDNILGVGQQKSSSPISLQVSKAINSQASKSKTSKTAGSIETEEIEIEFEDDDDQTSQPVKTYTAPQPIQTSKTVSTQQPAQKQQPFDPWAGLNQLFDDLSGNKKK